MSMLSQSEIIDLVKKTKAFVQKFEQGQIDLNSFRDNPAALLGQYDIYIPESNRPDLKQTVNGLLIKHGINKFPLSLKVSAGGMGCVACELGLTIVFAAILILTVAVVAAAIAEFATGIAVAIAVAFLNNTTAIKIVFGIIVIGVEILAALICTKLIKCT